MDPKTLELLGIGRRLADDLGTDLSAVLVGVDLAQIADEVASYGADRVYRLENPLLERYNSELWVEALQQLCGQINPNTILMLHSYIGMEVAPKLAYRLNTVLTSDCTSLEVDQSDDHLLRTKPVYGGNAVAVFKHKEAPQFVTVRPRAMEPAERNSRKCEIIRIAPNMDESIIKVESIETVKEDAVELEKADVIISGGRGIGGTEGFEVIEELAELFRESFENVEVGASRPAVDLGWISSNRQVGLTGEKVSPSLYMAVGISGAIQHLVGITRAKRIVAINTDSKSPIFDVADYGVVGDYQEVLPAFMKKWRGLS
ncbi:MAG: electron transfer flavoprotein subunit alpha/FixB family protein [Dehalococcoidales bacterium]|nr:electron transfer flavoprotein subunit alpha/FixB family protein [Dehalococcoidales bacterium]